VSHVHRLQTSDRIFFITVNLGRALPPLAGEEYGLLVDAVAESRQKLHFLLYGYVLMPDHWHALIWTTYPLTISRVVQDIKWAGGPRFGGERVPHPCGLCKGGVRKVLGGPANAPPFETAEGWGTRQLTRYGADLPPRGSQRLNIGPSTGPALPWASSPGLTN
jgi:hypothetical protein